MRILKRIKLWLRLSRNDRNRRRYNLGKYSYFGANTRVGDTQIGKYCSIGDNCIFGMGGHPTNALTTSCVAYIYDSLDRAMKARYFDVGKKNLVDCTDIIKPPTVIGNDVWIGHNVLIHRGVVIGHGAVIGMGAVVVKDVPPYAIVGGVPAKIIKYRFNNEVIKELLNLRWWDYPESFVKTLPFGDLEKCIDMLKSNVKLRGE